MAVLGQDASTPKLLLDHARAAATEARRRSSSEVCFFTDTMRLQALARLDIAREMRDAIASRDIRLRYVGRHDLETGRLTAWVGYLRWLHPLRGEILRHLGEHQPGRALERDKYRHQFVIQR